MLHSAAGDERDGAQVDCPLRIGERVVLDDTVLYGQVIDTSDGDVDHDGEGYFLCAHPLARVAWDDGITETHSMDELLVERVV